MKDVTLVQVVDILTGDHIDPRVPFLVKRKEFFELLVLKGTELREIFLDDVSHTCNSQNKMQRINNCPWCSASSGRGIRGRERAVPLLFQGEALILQQSPRMRAHRNSVALQVYGNAV
jgi:hypothetical protein